MDVLDFESRRKFPRRQFFRKVGFLFEGQYYLGVGCEVGEGGLSLSLPRSFPISNEAVLTFLIPGGSFISVRVEIRNMKPDLTNSENNIIGCAFQNLQFEHKREIRTYVSARPVNERQFSQKVI